MLKVIWRKAVLENRCGVIEIGCQSNAYNRQEVRIKKMAKDVGEVPKQILPPVPSQNMLTLKYVVVSFVFVIAGWATMLEIPVVVVVVATPKKMT
jgi:hypothetical protein